MKERIVAVLGMVSLLTTVGCANMMGQDKNKAAMEKAFFSCWRPSCRS